jgi:hypothetical protein
VVVATLLSFIKFLRVDKIVTDAISTEFLSADGTAYPTKFAAAAVPCTAAFIAGGGKIGAGLPAGHDRPATLQPFRIGASTSAPTVYIQFEPSGALPIQLTRRQLREATRLIAELNRLFACKDEAMVEIEARTNLQ